MKKIAIVLQLVIGIFYFASGQKKYYISPIGNDLNNGLTPTAAWKSLAKVNSMFDNFTPGDQILFKRGGTFYGSLIVNKSGTSGKPIVISTYGNGLNPIITGFKLISKWKGLGDNLWESDSTVSTLPTCNIVTIMDVNTVMGRLPKKGFWTIKQSSATSISDNSHFNASTNWTGAELVSKNSRWHLERAVIKSSSDDSVNFFLAYKFIKGWGYFLQNDLKTLTQQNDWYYNPATGKLTMYSIGVPQHVKQATIDTLVHLGSSDYITLSNITFTGANGNAVELNNRSHITIQACNFNYIGKAAVYTATSQDVKISNCTISECNNQGVNLGISNNTIVTGNNLNYIGNLPGMGESGSYSYVGIISQGNNSIVSYNKIIKCGYIGIRWDGNSTVIQGNFIDSTNYIKDDGGGIHCFPLEKGDVLQTFTQRTVRDNIVLNALGAPDGLSPSAPSEAYCIYNDNTSPNVKYINNTMANAKMGLFFHGGYNNMVDSNTTYNCTYGFFLNNYKPSVGIENITVTNNIFVATKSGAADTGQYCIYYDPGASGMPGSFKTAGNVYARPPDSKNEPVLYNFGSGKAQRSTLSEWKSLTGKDNGSMSYPIVSNSGSLRLIYNNSGVKKAIALPPGKYIDIKGNRYTKNVKLAPYSSVVLIQKG